MDDRIETGVAWRNAAEFLGGAGFVQSLEPFYPRLDPADIDRLPIDTWAAACWPASVCLRVRASGAALELRWRRGTASTRGPLGLPPPSFELWDGDTLIVREVVLIGGDHTGDATAEEVVRLPLEATEAHDYVVYLPEELCPLITGVRGDGATLEPVSGLPRVLVYGDSIAQGWVASSPARSWVNRVGRGLSADMINVGLAGAGRGEIVVAEQLASVAADVIVVAYGTNCHTRVPHSAIGMHENVRCFLALLRQGHPHTPIVVVSPIVRPAAEAAVNALGATHADLRRAIEAIVGELIATGDAGLTLVEGADLLSAELLADGIHPSDAGHEAMAQALTPVIAEALARGDA